MAAQIAVSTWFLFKFPFRSGLTLLFSFSLALYTFCSLFWCVSATLSLTDINECSIPNLCGSHANCKNTNGSFNCHCHPGYRHFWGLCKGEQMDKSLETFFHMTGGVRRENLGGVDKIKLGSGKIFKIHAFQRLRTPVALTFKSHCCCTKIHATFFMHSYPRRFELNEVVPDHTLWTKKEKSHCQWIAEFTAILYWTYPAELTNDPSFRVNQKWMAVRPYAAVRKCWNITARFATCTTRCAISNSDFNIFTWLLSYLNNKWREDTRKLSRPRHGHVNTKTTTGSSEAWSLFFFFFGRPSPNNSG